MVLIIKYVTRVKYLSLFLFIISMNSCKHKENLLLGASDELYSIKLYATNNKFEILHNAINTAEGKYSISHDTVSLIYDANEFIKTNNGKLHANEVLVRTLIINDSLGIIHSLDKRTFFASIYLNKISKHH